MPTPAARSAAPAPTLMIRPAGLASKPGNAALVLTTAVFRLLANIASQPSISPCSRVCQRNPPAMLTRTSIEPSFARTVSIAVFTLVTRVRSTPPNTQCGAGNSAITGAAGWEWPRRATASPRSRKVRATARPRLPNAPVTTTERREDDRETIGMSLQERGEPPPDDIRSLLHDASDELRHGRDVVNQALHLPGPDEARVDVAGLEHHLSEGAAHQMRYVLELRIGALQDLHDLVGDAVLAHTGGIAQRLEDHVSATLVIFDQQLLHPRMDRRLDRGAEPRSHVGGVGSEANRRREAPAVTEAARGDHGNLHLICRRRNEHEARHIVLARMPGALEAIDRDHIDPHALRREGVAHGGALVDHGDPVRLEVIDVLARVVARSLDDPDTTLDDDATVLGVRRRTHGRQNGQIDRERPVGHGPATLDLLPQRIGRRLRECRQGPECARVGNGGDQLRTADPHHATLNDGMLDAEQLCEASLQAELREKQVDSNEYTHSRRGTEALHKSLA